MNQQVKKTIFQLSKHQLSQNKSDDCFLLLQNDLLQGVTNGVKS